MAERRTGRVTLVGEPNAGKSTLMNHIVGTKVSIVTHKAQTTRSRILGIAIKDQTQIVFADTPGLFVPRTQLDQSMVSEVWRGLSTADIVLLIVQAHRGLTSTVDGILNHLKSKTKDLRSVSLVVNKIDLVCRDQLLSLVEQFSGRVEFERVFLISALKGDGVEDLSSWLANRLPVRGWIYPKDQIADASLQAMAAEITREKVLLRMHQEIPYQTAVETVRWQVRRDGSARVDQTILVVSKSHKRMIIGPGGKAIKQIGVQARSDIQTLVNCRIHLFLQVKVRPKWTDEAFRGTKLAINLTESSSESKAWPT